MSQPLSDSGVLTTMSLLRVCQQALPKHAIPRPITAYTRANSTAPIPPVQTRDLQEKQSTEITTPPEREVMVADAISGAPGVSYVLHHIIAELVASADKSWHMKLSCAIALCVSTSLLETPCKVVDQRASAGGLIGTFYKAPVGGRIP